MTTLIGIGATAYSNPVMAGGGAVVPATALIDETSLDPLVDETTLDILIEE